MNRIMVLKIAVLVVTTTACTPAQSEELKCSNETLKGAYGSDQWNPSGTIRPSGAAWIRWPN